jgi:hypothetical protein
VDDAYDTLRDATARGVTLLVDGDRIRARGRLTDDLRAGIRDHRDRLLVLLAAWAELADAGVPVEDRWSIVECMELTEGDLGGIRREHRPVAQLTGLWVSAGSSAA